jgi:DNA-binding CsgD family transcriptional regulator
MLPPPFDHGPVVRIMVNARGVAMDDRFERLTQRQRAALRLVRDGLSTKEIAKRLGTSPNAIDKAVKLAMARIGADRRTTAARMLAQYEDASGGQPQAPLSPALPRVDAMGEMEASPSQEAALPMVNEARAAFDARLVEVERPELPEEAGDEAVWGAGRRGIRSTMGRVVAGAALIALLLMAVCIAAVALSGATYFYQVSHHLRKP